jgi:hypothetical protein
MNESRGIQTQDTKTGTIYKSRYAASRAIAADYNLDPDSKFNYWYIHMKDPTRLVNYSCSVSDQNNIRRTK